MTSFLNRMPAASYNLLVQSDSDVDMLLTKSNKLRAAIQNAKLRNRKHIATELANLTSQLANTPTSDDVEYQSLRADLSSRISTLKMKMPTLILPSVAEMGTHVCWLRSTYKPFIETVFEYSKATVNNKPTLGGECEWDVPITENCFIGEQCIKVKLGELMPQSTLGVDKVRYADMVGHRMIKAVELHINNTKIDEYSGELYNAWFETMVSASKRPGWLQCVGHSLPMKGEVIQDPEFSAVTEMRMIYDGFQTISDSQPELTMYIPLLFWFNTDVSNALYVTPGTKMTIKVIFEEEKKLMTCLDVADNIYNEKYISPRLIDCDLYSNHIYMNKEVMDLFVSKIGFSMIRVHKTTACILDKNKDSVDLSKDFKFPVEDITFYARPLVNEEGIDSLNLWNRNSIQTLKSIQIPVIYKDKLTGEPQMGVNQIRYYKPTPLFESIDVSYDNVSPYGSDSELFYSAYIPLMTRGLACNGNGVYHVSYRIQSAVVDYSQPMGYANFSKSRKILLQYESSVVETNAPVKLYAHARAINFLIYDSSAASLQFSV